MLPSGHRSATSSVVEVAHLAHHRLELGVVDQAEPSASIVAESLNRDGVAGCCETTLTSRGVARGEARGEGARSCSLAGSACASSALMCAVEQRRFSCRARVRHHARKRRGSARVAQSPARLPRARLAGVAPWCLQLLVEEARRWFGGRRGGSRARWRRGAPSDCSIGAGQKPPPHHDAGPGARVARASTNALRGDGRRRPTTRPRASTVAVVTRRRSFTHEARQEAEAALRAACESSWCRLAHAYSTHT